MIQASFRIVAPENKRQEILCVLLRLKGPTEVSRGCQAFLILEDAIDPNVVTWVEQWATESDLEEHLRSERFRWVLPYIEMSLERPQIAFRTIDEVRGIEYLTAVLSPQG